MLIYIQALQVQAGHLADPPAGAFEQQVGQDRHAPGLIAEHAQAPVSGTAGGAGDGAQDLQVRVELGDDVCGQGPARFLLGDVAPAVAAADREGRREAGEQSHVPGLSQHEGAVLDDAGGPPGAVGLAA